MRFIQATPAGEDNGRAIGYDLMSPTRRRPFALRKPLPPSRGAILLQLELELLQRSRLVARDHVCGLLRDTT